MPPELGDVSEWFKEAVLKTIRGFKSYHLRHFIYSFAEVPKWL